MDNPSETWPRLGLCGLLFFLASQWCINAGADPRWWWNDLGVTQSSKVESVDVAVVKTIPDDKGRPHPVFLVWSEPPGMIGNIYLTASFDGGCSFCTPVRIVGTFWDSTPKIAVAALESGSFAIQVAFSQGMSSARPLEIGTDAVTVPVDAAPSEQCAALQNIVLTRREISQQAKPFSFDIAGETLYVAPDFLTHFHLVWVEENTLSELDVHHARDLAGDGTGWQVTGNLTAGTPPSQSLSNARLAMDFMVDEAPPLNSAVNVAFVDQTTGEVLFLRSTDSGTTFSATGDPVPSPPESLRDPDPSIPDALAFDSGFFGFATDAATWHAAAWDDPRASGLGLYLDGQRTQVSGISPPWVADIYLDPEGQPEEGDPALAVMSRPTAGQADVVVVWTDSGPGGYDLFYRGGALQDAVFMDVFPFDPVRPLDPSVSTSLLLTSCAFDETTFDCLSTRTAGKAALAALDKHDGNAYVAWIDERAGRQEVWFKRSDRQVGAPAVTLTTECVSAAETKITVYWPPLPTCAVAAEPERMVRYLVYYSQDPGGPYINTDLAGDDPTVPDTIVVVDDGNLPDPVIQEITGLAADTTYYVIVVPEDEARNVYPPPFDPMADGVSSPANEADVTTPKCSGPCTPFAFGGQTQVQPLSECTMTITWAPAQGENPIYYTVTRTPAFPSSPPPLVDPFYTDTQVDYGTSYTYQVAATDSCPPPDGPASGQNQPSNPVFPIDDIGPQITNESLTQLLPCTVSIFADLVADCAALETMEVQRETDGVPPVLDTFPVASLPFEDTVAGNGTYTYTVRALDLAGNETLSNPMVFVATECSSTENCLHRVKIASIDPVQPSKDGVFTAQDAQGVSLDPAHPDVEYQYVCPFVSGDSEPEQVLAGSQPLIFYQIDNAPVAWIKKDLPNNTVVFTY